MEISFGPLPKKAEAALSRQALPPWMKPEQEAINLRMSPDSGEEEKVFCDLLVAATNL